MASENIYIHSLDGKVLLSVLITEEALFHEELMTSDYVMLSWNSDSGMALPLGSYIIYNGEKYSLLEEYNPERTDEYEYRFSPQFHSRIMGWQKQPVPLYTYGEDGITVTGREFDWEFTGSPTDAMYMVQQAIKNETGETWSVQLADSLPATISVSSQSDSIFSLLSQIADACKTEWWVDKSTNTLFLSFCQHGSPVSLSVGVNIKAPSVTSGNKEYFTRFYAFGSTRNITQDNEGGQAINHIINKRLTLDPAKYPGGYKDVKGHFDNGVFVSDLKPGEIFSTTVYLDDIYPKSKLTISDVRARLKYRLDSGTGDKVQVGTDDDGSPIYEQYAIWYFKIANFSFDLNSIIEGENLSVSFETGQLAGRDFELSYHEKAETVKDGADVTEFEVEAGDYEIILDETSGITIPGLAYIIPQDGDQIVLYNIKMPNEYVASAREELETAIDKEISTRTSDNNSYEFDSDPVSFNDDSMDVMVGQSVNFSNIGTLLQTRVLMVEKHLDYPCQQRIRVGNERIKGNTQQLKEDVTNASQNIDLLKAFNNLSQSLTNAYANAQREMIEGFASIKNMWRFDPDDPSTIYSEFNAYVKGAFSALGKSTETGGGGSFDLLQDWAQYDAETGKSTALSAYLGYELYQKLQSGAVLSLKSEGTGNVVTGISKNGTVLTVTKGSIDLSPYATKGELDDRIDELVNGAPAAFDTLKEIADVLQGNVDSIGDIITTLGTKADKAVKITAGAGLTGGGDLSANRTLALAAVGTVGTYTKVTTDAYGRVTAGTTLSAADIPTLAISKISGLQAALDSKLNAADFAQYFAEQMAQWFVRDTGNKALRPADYGGEAYGLYSNAFVSALGVSQGSASGGGSVDILQDWAQYDAGTAKSTALSAYLGYGLYQDVQSLKGGAALTVETTGGGNVVTGISKSGTKLTVAKGITALTSVSLATITDLNSSWDALLKAAPAVFVTRWPSISEVTGKQNLVLKLNGGTTEGTNLFTYNGTSAKSVNITTANIGADAKFVTALGTSGKYLTWTKNGTTNNITVPYATNARNIGWSWNVSTKVGTYSKLLRIEGLSNILLSVILSQNSQASSHLYLISTGYDIARIIQIGANGYSSQSGAKIRITLANSTYMTFDVELLNSYGYNSATTLNVSCRAVRCDTVSTITPYTSYTEGSGVVKSELISSYNTIVSDITGNVYGNASTATKLQTARTLWGQSFNGTANVDGTIRVKTTTGNFTEGIRLYGTAASGSWSNINFGCDPSATSGTHTNQWILGRNSSNHFVLDRGNSTGASGFVVTTAGNMGIGTTSPSYKLHVAGTGYFSGQLTAQSFKLGSGTISWDSDNNCFRFSHGLYSDEFVSALGLSDTAGGGGGDYNRLDDWSDYDTSKSTWALSAKLGYELYEDVTSLKNGSALNFTTTGSGNVVSAITKSGTTVTVNKGITALTRHQSIYALTIQGNGTAIGTFNPKSAAATINITPANIGAPTKTGSGASGTWGISISGNAATATKLGTATVGGTAKPIYLNGGTATALSATVGSATRPVYLDAGTITAGAYSFGNGNGNAPINNGTLNTNLNADLLDGVHESSLVRMTGRNRIYTSDQAPYAYIHLFRVANSSPYSTLRIDVDVKTRYHAAILHIDIETHLHPYGAGGSSITIHKQTCNGRSGTFYYKRTVQSSGYNYYDIYYQCRAWNSGGYGIISKGNNGTLVYEPKGTNIAALPDGCTELSETSYPGNASTATKLLTARQINGTNFDGSANITTAKWGTARSIYIRDASQAHTGAAVSVDGSANEYLLLPSTIAAALEGNATSATKLQTARTLWGQSFNGTANVSGDMSSVGNITMANNTILKATMGSNDYWRIYGSGDSDLGSMYIETGDNGDEPIYVRQLRAGGTATHTITLMDGSGNQSFLAVTASGLLTANGGILVPSSKTLKIGSGTISWDTANNMFHFSHGLYSDGAVSALGVGSASGGGGGGSVDILQDWAQYDAGTAKSTALSAYLGYEMRQELQSTVKNIGNTPDYVCTLDLSDIDLDFARIQQAILGKRPMFYIVTDNSVGNYVVGTMCMFSDNSHHVLTQVLTTHFLVQDGVFSAHVDSKVYTYYRSYNFSAPGLEGPTRQWTEWREAYGLTGEGSFMGVATPSTAAPSLAYEEEAYYVAATAGTYANLGGLTVASGEVALIRAAYSPGDPSTSFSKTTLSKAGGAVTIASITDLHSSWDSVLKAQKPSWLTSVSIATISDLNSGWDALLKATPSSHITRWPTFSEVSSKPTTLSGYGITDAVGASDAVPEGMTITRAASSFGLTLKTIAGGDLDELSLPMATTSLAGLMSASDKTKLNSALTSVSISSITDLNSSWDALLKAAPAAATASKMGFMSASDKAKMTEFSNALYNLETMGLLKNDGNGYLERLSSVTQSTNSITINFVAQHLTSAGVPQSGYSIVTLPAASTTKAGLMSASDKTTIGYLYGARNTKVWSSISRYFTNDTTTTVEARTLVKINDYFDLCVVSLTSTEHKKYRITEGTDAGPLVAVCGTYLSPEGEFVAMFPLVLPKGSSYGTATKYVINYA